MASFSFWTSTPRLAASFSRYASRSSSGVAATLVAMVCSWLSVRPRAEDEPLLLPSAKSVPPAIAATAATPAPIEMSLFLLMFCAMVLLARLGLARGPCLPDNRYVREWS